MSAQRWTLVVEVADVDHAQQRARTTPNDLLRVIDALAGVRVIELHGEDLLSRDDTHEGDA